MRWLFFIAEAAVRAQQKEAEEAANQPENPSAEE